MFLGKSLPISIWLRARMAYAPDFARVHALKLDCELRRQQIHEIGTRFSSASQQLMHLEIELQEARMVLTPTIDEDQESPAPPNTKEFLKQKKQAKTISPNLLQRIDELTKARAIQIEQVKKLRENIAQLELEEKDAINARFAAEAELQTKIGNMLSKAGHVVNRTTTKLDRYEASIVQKEVLANASFSKLTDASADFESKKRKTSDELERKTEEVARAISAAMSSFGKLIEVSDPSIENAYRRLEKMIAASQKAAEKSEEVERKLELSIEFLQVDSKAWQNRAASFDAENTENPILLNVLARQKSCDDATAELSAAIVAHKTKNLANAHVLFRVDGIARRLGLLKSLIAALPTQTKDDSHLFAQISDAVCSYLQSSIQQDVESSKDSLKQTANVLTQRIYDLEQNVLLKYLQFAKVDLKNVDSKRALKFKRDCDSISAALQLERESSTIELSRWEVVVKQAIEDKMQLLQSVAEQRIDHYAGVIKMASQAIDVLSVVTMRVTQ